MFYEAKILDAYGNLKEIISCKELKRRNWENYKIMEENCNAFAKTPRKRKSRNDFKNIKSDLDQIGDETY